MARRDRPASSVPPGVVRFCRDEDGKVAIVSIFAVLAIGGMIGLVVNSGRAVREKVELQNAADAAAATTTLWMARSMNAVTTSNHLMGEATAIVVLLDGFAGPPRFGSGKRIGTDTTRSYHTFLGGLKGSAPIVGTAAAASMASPFDRQFVNFVVNLLTTNGGDLSVGAALYDAKLTLRYVAIVCLTVKTFANFVLPVAGALEGTLILAPIGAGLEIAALTTHAGMNILLAKVATEWLQLEIVERMVAVGGPAISKGILDGVLPGLTRYADTVVGSAGVSGGTNRAIRQSLDSLVEEHRLESLEIIPPVERLRLPVEREPPPAAGGGSQPQRGWTRNFESDETKAIGRGLDTLTGEIKNAISSLGDMLSFVGSVVGALGSALNGGKPPKWAKDATDGMDKLKDLANKSLTLPQLRPESDGFATNPSFRAEQLPTFDWKSEKLSQWARATYPYVDDYRGPIVAWLKRETPLSNAATYYVNWTNRFTLVRSYRLRGDQDRTHMYVVRGMRPREKGNEPWVIDHDAARDMFAVVAVATRTPAATFMSRIFPVAEGGQVAVAGGLLYNANGNRSETAKSPAHQPDTGWDTLNWAIPVQAPEWGEGRPSDRGSDPWAVFRDGKRVGPGAAVRLNWQGKLVPVDRDLLGRSEGETARFIIRHEQLLRH
jgi:hypothetical protein